MIRFVIFVCALASMFGVNAQIITTVAGSGAGSGTASGGYSGNHGPATLAQMNNPLGVFVDINGNIYISDEVNNCIRKVDTFGIITTIAGIDSIGFGGDNGPATLAKFNYPGYLYFNTDGRLYIPDGGNFRIRMIDTNGDISTFAGDGSVSVGGDGGLATATAIGAPFGITMDKSGNLYFTDAFCKVRKINPSGIITTVAGKTMGYGGDGQPADSAELNGTADVTLDRFGNLYITDLDNQRVRKVDTNGIITTIAGTGMQGYFGDNGPATLAQLNYPEGIVVDNDGNVFFADEGNNCVRKIDTNGIITTIVGDGFASFGGDNGPATAAYLNAPAGLALDKHGNLYIADWYNNRIRKVTNVGVMVNEVKEVVQEKSEYLVYPNPASKTVTIDGVIGCEVAMYDMLGNEKWKGRSEKSKVVIDVSGWVNGVYILEITDVGTGERVVKRVVKE